MAAGSTGPAPGKERYVYDVFQNVATGYDKANVRISAGQQGRWKSAAADLLCEGLAEGTQRAGSPADGHGDAPCVLDIGCGTGDMLLLVHDRCPQAQLTGIDFSPHMLEQALGRCEGIEGISLVEGNALDLPFDDDSFDGVTIAFALRNTADYVGALSEALRVLRPGARFVCIDSFVPANPVVRPFYRLYFGLLMPLLGGGVRKLRQYRWLSRSTREFVSVRELEDLMGRVGFVRVQDKSFMCGACVCVMGECRAEC